MKPPTRLCCGTPHFGVACPDGKTMCCICFDRVETDQLNRTPGGHIEDVCKKCAGSEPPTMCPHGLIYESCPSIACKTRWCSFAPAPLLGQFNFAWIIIYLRNGGERIRAIILARDALGITLTEAREWVDSVKLNRRLVSMEANRKLHAEYPGGISEEQLRDHLECEVSHWPNGQAER